MQGKSHWFPVCQQDSNWKSGRTMWPSSPVQLWCSFYWAQNWLQVATQRGPNLEFTIDMGDNLHCKKTTSKCKWRKYPSRLFPAHPLKKSCPCLWCVCFACTGTKKWTKKHEQKNCCIRSLSKSSVLTVTWCSGKNPTKLDLQRLQHIRLSLSSHTSSRAKSHTIIPSIKMKCWDKEV